MNAQIGNPDAPAVSPGNYTTIINNGVIAPGLGRFNNTFDNTVSQFVPLTLAGNYKAGNGATVEIHTELLDDMSRHGSLTIDGVIDPSSDKSGTRVVVIHQGGNGATTDHGIEIIRLRGNGSGASQADLIRQLGENFHLASDFKTARGQNAVVAGAYSYVMASDIDWYGNPSDQAGLFLRNARNSDGSRVLHPATPLYESYLLVLSSLNKLPTLEQRVGHRIWMNDADQDGVTANSDMNPLLYRGQDESDSRGVWMRVEGLTGHYTPELGSDGDSSYDLRFGRLNLGLDLPVYETDNGSRLVVGINGHMSRAWAEINSSQGDGDISANGHGIGATLTWFDRSGFYADAQARQTWFLSDISSDTITSASHQVENNDAAGYAFSLELGRIFDLDAHWSLTPQAQLVYSRINFDSFTDPQNSVIINEEDYTSLEGRLGLALNYENSYRDDSGTFRRNKLYLLGNVYHEFNGNSTISISGVNYESNLSDTWLSMGIGGSLNWDDDRFSLYGEVRALSSTQKFGEEYGLTGEIGVRIAF